MRKEVDAFVTRIAKLNRSAFKHIREARIDDAYEAIEEAEAVLDRLLIKHSEKLVAELYLASDKTIRTKSHVLWVAAGGVFIAGLLVGYVLG
ncbi:hypothetical protein SAMN05216302_101463 [Nitrosomonas aestuarii]|uniref:Uncharacterized protein n=1 Tax=Nitrosomonas aestuarii TaxID=52441 RepID=A0A1I4C2P0_9PROT|nr:hypothetical protein [Nitrosomonas aestuarii]SFK75195.1 hypothetical protein SAMN05216302_101463 [Nitrosomonas aestuarii]